VPDLDIFRRITRLWRQPARLVHGEASEHEVGAGILHALCAELRDGGLSSLAPVLRVADDLDNGRLSVIEARNEVQRIEKDHFADRNTEDITRVARRCLTAPVNPLASPGRQEELCRDLVRSLIQSRLFGRIAPEAPVKWPRVKERLKLIALDALIRLLPSSIRLRVVFTRSDRAECSSSGCGRDQPPLNCCDAPRTIELKAA
jgi:hypothetical protein